MTPPCVDADSHIVLSLYMLDVLCVPSSSLSVSVLALRPSGWYKQDNQTSSTCNLPRKRRDITEQLFRFKVSHTKDVFCYRGILFSNGLIVILRGKGAKKKRPINNCYKRLKTPNNQSIHYLTLHISYQWLVLMEWCSSKRALTLSHN